MICYERLLNYLREQRVPFEVQHHRLAYAAQDVAAIEHISNERMVKVVMVFADGVLTMLALPASHRVDLAHLASAIGAKEVYLAGEREIAAAFPDCEVGAMPPFGHLYGVRVYVDRLLANDEQIVFQAGTHTETISMAYAEYARLALPIVADFARHFREIATTI
ncbi:MAG TPA: YbaK/EbsC family protein [Roseiflexaceae bacterium]|nr:YbaK/EbsC family protein [Roseiflexaceae bacterium]